MSKIPRETRLDHSLALLRDGYRFISKRCQRYKSDIFETRLMFQKAICIMGAEAAQEFYVPGRFTRRGAFPRPALWLLQDQGSASVMDGTAHHWRKQMFMSVMTPESLQRAAELLTEQWQLVTPRWKAMDRIVLLDELHEILCRTICQWTGVPLNEKEVEQRTRELVAMIDGAGAFGPRNWRAHRLRARTERWIRGIVRQVRAHTLDVPESTALYAIAWHRDVNGKLLSTPVAAIELLNILRPTMAVGNYIMYAALALHDHPKCRQRLERGDEDYLQWFVQEVRRYYPVFPLIAGRVLQEFDWRGYHFKEGTWVILDLYGTNHDRRTWSQPEVFQPERFQDSDGNGFNLIPQGGGDYFTDHRCAGEWLTVQLIAQAVRLLMATRFKVPPQDFRFSLSRMPALPKSRFVIQNVH